MCSVAQDLAYTVHGLDANVENTLAACLHFFGRKLTSEPSTSQVVVFTKTALADTTFPGKTVIPVWLGKTPPQWQHYFLAWPCAQNDLMQLIGQIEGRVGQVMEPAVESFLSASMIGVSPLIMKVRSLIAKVAHTDASVLITGPSGSGKEIAAKSIHLLSKRSKKPFIAVNCGAIPAELLESELFGHEKGAFTGAYAARIGRFEQAEGGTLFLDEIGDMPIAMQVKLLRVLQEKTFEKVGGNKTQLADVRIIAATHRDIESMIEQGKFREDLYYRLNVFPIHTPALQERSEDIPFLMVKLLQEINHTFKTNTVLAKETSEILQQYDWPGNIRELSNLLERLSVLYPDSIVFPAHLPEKYQVDSECSKADPAFDLKMHIAEIECQWIKKALQEENGIVAKAAMRLGLRRTTLVEKMRKYAILSSTV